MTTDDRIALIKRISAIDIRKRNGTAWPSDPERRAQYMEELEADSRRRRLQRELCRR